MSGHTAPLFVPVVTTYAGLRAAADACASGARVRPAISLEIALASTAGADVRQLARGAHGVLLHNVDRVAPPPAVWRAAALHLVRNDVDVSCVLDVDSPGLAAIWTAVAGSGARIAI